MSKIDIAYTYKSAYGREITHSVTVNGKKQAERFCRKIELIPGYRIKDVSAHIDWDEQMAWLRDGEDPLR